MILKPRPIPLFLVVNLGSNIRFRSSSLIPIPLSFTTIKTLSLLFETETEIDLISCWSGLRISDFLYNLKTDNIKDGFISIKTQKTKTFVKLPIHNHIKHVLNKRFGQLPKKMSATEYNKNLKIVCQLAEIDNLVYGKIWNPEIKRKECKYLPKYAFCTSHIGRKSLCTNLAGKVPNELIQSIFGWADSTMVAHYTKTTKTDYAEQLKSYWNGE